MTLWWVVFCCVAMCLFVTVVWCVAIVRVKSLVPENWSEKESASLAKSWPKWWDLLAWKRKSKGGTSLPPLILWTRKTETEKLVTIIGLIPNCCGLQVEMCLIFNTIKVFNNTLEEVVLKPLWLLLVGYRYSWKRRGWRCGGLASVCGGWLWDIRHSTSLPRHSTSSPRRT